MFWADCVRSLAVVCIVAAHTLELPYQLLQEAIRPATLTATPVLAGVMLLLAKTGVPLFLLLSGALLIGKDESDRVFLMKRVRRVCVPWFFWTLLYFLLQREHSFLQTATAQFSFIPVLLCLYLLVPYLRPVARSVPVKKLGLLVLAWFFAVSVLPMLRNSLAFPLSVDNGVVRQVISYLGYFLGGFVVTREAFVPVLKKYRSALATVFLFLIIGSSLALFYTAENTSALLTYTSPLVIVLSFLLFMIVKIFLSEETRVNPLIQKSIYSVSSVSFGMYFFHTLVLQALQVFVPVQYTISLGSDVLRVLFVCGVSYGVLILVTRIRVLKWVLV